MTRRRFVIVGANLAGGRAAETLRAEGFDGDVILIGAEMHRPYERPPLSKEVLRGEQEPDRAYLRDDAWYAENGIDLRLGVRATALDPAGGTLALSDGETLRYDACLLATGGEPRRLDVPGAGLEGVLTLRTVDDALAIRGRLASGAPLVVVGAGFIGAEVAASARLLGCPVTVLEIAPVPLGRALGPEVGAIYAEIHRERGVDLHLGVGVERIEAAAAGSLTVHATDGSRHEASAVVVGIGIAPAIELAAGGGLGVGDGILVDEMCRTSAPGVYAAGDVANHPNPVLGHRLRVEHWQNAQNQGAAAARAMLGAGAPFAEVPWFWSDQYDLTLQTFGHAERWDEVVFRGDVASRSFCAFYLEAGRIVQALGVNRPRDTRAARPLIENRIRVEPAVLADEDADLRALARTAASPRKASGGAAP